VTTKNNGRGYLEITLEWDYTRHQFHPSMPGYIKKALKLFQHDIRKQQQQLFPTVPLHYGPKKQYATQESKAPCLDAKGKKFIQQVC
jgi:hypothetical protein